MASAFNNTGSGTPIKGPTKGFGSFAKSAVDNMNQKLNKKSYQGLYGTNANYQTSGGANYAAPSTPTQPQQQPSVNTSSSPMASTPMASNPTTPVSTAPKAGNPMYYANRIEEVSRPNALATGAANASALYGMLGNEAKLAPFAGGTTQGLLNSYANITRPQTTANLAGTKGLFDVQQGILQNAANTVAQQALEQQKIEQSGASTNLNASLPQGFAYGSNVINPLTGQSYGAGGGGGGPFEGGMQLGNLNLGQQFSQTVAPAYKQAGTIKDSFVNFLAQNPQINSSSLNIANAAQQWLQGKQLSDPNQAKLGQFLTEFTNTLTPIIGSAGDVTNFKQELVNQLVNSTASGQSITQAINNLYDIAGMKVRDIVSSGTGYNFPTNTSGGTTGGGGIYNF